jgi:AbrB family looped-hinge helix DNA binding protein
MATSRMTAKGQIMIPKALGKRLGLLPGDEVEFVMAGSDALVEVMRGR